MPKRHFNVRQLSRGYSVKQKNNFLNIVIITGYLMTTSLHGMKEMISLNQGQVRVFDQRHQLLNQFRKFSDSWWRLFIPYVKDMWSVLYVVKGSADSSRQAQLFHIFFEWYTKYLRDFIGDLNKLYLAHKPYDLPLGYAGWHKMPGLLKMLKKLGVQYKTDLYSQRMNPLLVTRSITVAKFLIEDLKVSTHGCDDVSKGTILHAVATNYNYPAELIALYINHGAYVNAHDEQENTPLQLIIPDVSNDWQQYEKMKLLVKNGALVNHKNKRNETVLDILYQADKINNDLLEKAIESNKTGHNGQSVAHYKEKQKVYAGMKIYLQNVGAKFSKELINDDAFYPVE
jgi:hypothetical protein